MLEARFNEASTLKKVLDSVKDLVSVANLDCNDSGIALQAMDDSRVTLIALLLRSQGFEHYRCDRSHSLGLSLANLSKVLKCAANEDSVTIKGEDEGDLLSLVFESSKVERVSSYDLKLMDIDADHLGIPETEFSAIITMSSAEFQRICRDLTVLSDSVTIDVSKEGITFSNNGEIGNGSIKIKQRNSNEESGDPGVSIELRDPVSLVFSLKYLLNFTKATPLCNTVKLSLASGIPILVEYDAGDVGYIRYYLAPKIGGDEDEAEE